MTRISVLIFASSLAACSAVGDDAVDTAPVETTSTTDSGLYDVVWSITPDPHAAGTDCALSVQVSQDGTAVAVTEATVTPWMPSMDHGINGDVTLVDTGVGAFDATWVYSMPGAWEVTVELDAEPGQDELKLVFDVQ